MKKSSKRFPDSFIKSMEGKLLLCRILVGESDSVYMAGIFKADIVEQVFKMIPVNIDDLKEDILRKIPVPSLAPVTTYFSLDDLSYIADLFDQNEVNLSV